LNEFSLNQVIPDNDIGCRGPKENRYEGEWFQNEKNGIGCMWWGDDRYIGQWECSSKNGNGTMLWKNGDIYEGGWYKDLRQGKAVYTYQNGGKFIGEYASDDRHGFGRFIWPDEDIYEGEWKFGGRFGKGTFTSKALNSKIEQEWEESSTINYSKELPSKYPNKRNL